MKFKIMPEDELVIITADPEDKDIRLCPGCPAHKKSVRIDSDLPVILSPRISLLNLFAFESDVIAKGHFTLDFLAAKSYAGDDDLTLKFGGEIAGDVRLSGDLIVIKKFPCDIRGGLSCDNININGNISVGGRVQVKGDVHAASIQVGQPSSVKGCLPSVCFDGKRNLKSEDYFRDPPKIVLARSGFAVTGDDDLERVRCGTSDTFMARAITSLTETQNADIATMSGVTSAQSLSIIQSAMKAAQTALEEGPNAFLDESLIDRIFKASAENDDSLSHIRDVETVITTLFNAALGTHSLLESLPPIRADQVKHYDNALDFLSRHQDESERHYFVEDAREAIEASVDIPTQDDLDEAVYELVSALANPDHTTIEEAIAAAGKENAYILSAEFGIVQHLMQPASQDPSPGL